MAISHSSVWQKVTRLTLLSLEDVEQKDVCCQRQSTNRLWRPAVRHGLQAEWKQSPGGHSVHT